MTTKLTDVQLEVLTKCVHRLLNDLERDSLLPIAVIDSARIPVFTIEAEGKKYQLQVSLVSNEADIIPYEEKEGL